MFWMNEFNHKLIINSSTINYTNELIISIESLLLSFISLIGGLLMIFFFFIFMKKEFFTQRMVLYLGITNIYFGFFTIFSQAHIFTIHENENIFCKFQAYFLLNSQLFQMLLIISLSTILFFKLTIPFLYFLNSRSLQLFNEKITIVNSKLIYLEVFSVFFSLLTALIITTILFLNDDFGRNNFGCWIKNGHSAFLMDLLQIIYYFVLFFILVLTVVVLIFVACIPRFHFISFDNQDDIFQILTTNTLVLKHSFHFILFLVLRIPYIIWILYKLASNRTEFWMTFIMKIYYVQGLVDVLVFVFNTEFFEKNKHKFWKMLFCIKKKNKENLIFEFN
jgi:hypothetical protein